MKKRRHFRKVLMGVATSVGICVAALATTSTGTADAVDPTVDRVLVVDTHSTMTINLAAPENSAEVLGDLPSSLQGAPSEVVGTELLIYPSSSTSSKASAVAASDGYADIYCDTYNAFVDGDGTYSVQRACGVNKAPWGWQMSPQIQDICVDPAVEDGMQWTVNGVTKPRQAPHAATCGYQFHGTYTVSRGDKLTYADRIEFEHNVGGGGYAYIDISGRLQFRGPLP
jgi:hypothetical protein